MYGLINFGIELSEVDKPKQYKHDEWEDEIQDDGDGGDIDSLVDVGIESAFPEGEYLKDVNIDVLILCLLDLSISVPL